jgi:non-specific serine/threonine protein kinase
MITGTPAYLPPEVARGAQPTAASDVFSLGATLYTAIEGQPPFGMDDDTGAIVERAAMAQIIPPSRSGVLTRALLHMMEPAPQRRPTMAEAREEILAAAFGPGAASNILGAPVRTEDGTIPAWAARNSAAGLRSPRSGPLPRRAQPQPPRAAAVAAPTPRPASRELSPTVAVTIGLLIGLLIIIVILVMVM